MGVIAACIPSLRPLVALIWYGNHSGPTLTGSTKNAQTNLSTASSRTIWPVGRGHKDDEDKIGGFTRLEESGRWGHNADIRGGRQQRADGMDDLSLEELNPPMEGIRVKNEVVVTTENWRYDDRLF